MMKMWPRREGISHLQLRKHAGKGVSWSGINNSRTGQIHLQSRVPTDEMASFPLLIQCILDNVKHKAEHLKMIWMCRLILMKRGHVNQSQISESQAMIHVFSFTLELTKILPWSVQIRDSSEQVHYISHGLQITPMHISHTRVTSRAPGKKMMMMMKTTLVGILLKIKTLKISSPFSLQDSMQTFILFCPLNKSVRECSKTTDIPKSPRELHGWVKVWTPVFQIQYYVICTMTWHVIGYVH